MGEPAIVVAVGKHYKCTRKHTVGTGIFQHLGQMSGRGMFWQSVNTYFKMDGPYLSFTT